MTSPILPALYDAADKASRDGQRAYLISRAAQLVLLVVAAASGAVVCRVGAYDAAGVASLVSFGAVVIIQFVVGWSAQQRAWYDGRAAAESVKHLAWRYAMRAEPYLDDLDVDVRFVKRMNDTLDEVKDLNLATARNDQITDWMRELRRADFLTRKATYVTSRIEDQQDWYRTKGAANRSSASRWRVVLYAGAAVGFATGILKTLTVLDVDALGVAATGVTAATAWMATKQYEGLSVSYGLALQELANVHSLAASILDDEAWSTFVNDAEDAISREHRMWKASRTGRTT